MMSVRSEFRKWHKDHPNFITPWIEKLAVKGNKVVELSSGRKMFQDDYNKLMYGVTKVERVGPNKFKTLGGKPFQTEKGAMSYFKKLKKAI